MDIIDRCGYSFVMRRKATTTTNDSGGSAPFSEAPPTPGGFHWDLWLVLCIENWVLDIGRPILALYVSVIPLSLPTLGDCCHLLYNVITALVLMKLLRRSLQPVPKIVQDLLVIIFVMGASIHLVGDSFSYSLIHCGYSLHLSVRDNPIIKNLSQPCLIESFELMYFYDEYLGHELWYIPLFATYLVYFYGCFSVKRIYYSRSLILHVLLVLSVIYQWYLITEGQLIVMYLLSLIVMVIIWMYNVLVARKHMDINGWFLLTQNVLTGFLIIMWVMYLWDDPVLRVRYPGWLYVPEPWSYWSLYLR